MITRDSSTNQKHAKKKKKNPPRTDGFTAQFYQTLIEK